MATLRILGGRKDKLRPGDILRALTGEACGLQSVTNAALAGLRAGRIKRMRFKVDVVE